MSLSKKTFLGGFAPLLVSGLLVGQMVTAAVAGEHDKHKGHAAHHGKSFAHFNKDGELLTPKDYREWVFVGAPVTPKDMNDGNPAFPEFHNVYIDPVSYAHWKKNGAFRDGTIIVKELASVGTKESSSGNGYFQGEFLGIAATVKDSKRYPNSPNHWAYFGFESYESKSAAAQADESCNACHKETAAFDNVFIQHYPVLRDRKSVV